VVAFRRIISMCDLMSASTTGERHSSHRLGLCKFPGQLTGAIRRCCKRALSTAAVGSGGRVPNGMAAKTPRIAPPSVWEKPKSEKLRTGRVGAGSGMPARAIVPVAIAAFSSGPPRKSSVMTSPIGKGSMNVIAALMSGLSYSSLYFFSC
jgi:hypothetical protein